MYEDAHFEKELFAIDFTPFICTDYYGSLCFEADIPQALRARKPEVTDTLLASGPDLESHTKLYFGLLPNGTMGMVYFYNKLKS